MIIGTSLQECIGFLDFLGALLSAVIAVCTATIVSMLILYRKKLREPFGLQEAKNATGAPVITDISLCMKLGIAVLFVLISFFLGSVINANVVLLAVIGAIALLLIAKPRNLQGALELVEWSTLTFFAALFVLVEAVREAGLIDAIARFMTQLLNKIGPASRQKVASTLIFWVSTLVSTVLDNILWTAVMVRVVEERGRSAGLNLRVPANAWSLSLGACIGDNGSLIGASANAVMVSMAEKRGLPHLIPPILSDWISIPRWRYDS